MTHWRGQDSLGSKSVALKFFFLIRSLLGGHEDCGVAHICVSTRMICLASFYTSSTRTNRTASVPWALDSPGWSQWRSLNFMHLKRKHRFLSLWQFVSQWIIPRLSKRYHHVFSRAGTGHFHHILHRIFSTLCIPMCVSSLITSYHFWCRHSAWARTQSFLDFSLVFPERNWPLIPCPAPCPVCHFTHSSQTSPFKCIVSRGFSWFVWLSHPNCRLWSACVHWVVDTCTPKYTLVRLWQFSSSKFRYLQNAIWFQLTSSLPVFYSNLL